MIEPSNLDSRKGAKTQRTGKSILVSPHTRLRKVIESRRDAETAELLHFDCSAVSAPLRDNLVSFATSREILTYLVAGRDFAGFIRGVHRWLISCIVFRLLGRENQFFVVCLVVGTLGVRMTSKILRS